MSTVALVIAIVFILPALWVARKATIRRLAWRNLASRPAEALLVTAGTMLGTAIIVASFVVGDTIEDGVGGIVDTSLGPIDESLTIEDPSELEALEAAIASAELTSTDGVISVLSLPTAVTTVGADSVGEPRVWIAEIDFDEARAFGGDMATSGFETAGPTPRAGEAVVISRVADQLGIAAGDQIQVHVYGATSTFTVRQIIERYSAAGWNSVYVAPGTIEGFVTNAEEGGQPSRAEVLVSNTGDFESGAVFSEEVVEQLEVAISSFDGVEIDLVKEDALEDAVAEGAEFTSLFNGIGSFAVIAGVLLIVNLFVMLAEERKTPLGVMRAIGFSRSQVTKVFAIEGAIYSLTASVAGVAAGVGVGWILVQVLKRIFLEENDLLTIGFSLQAESLMLAAAIGLGITMVTIWITAIRISQFNVIAAIRDLPQPPTRKGKVRTAVLSVIGMLVGAGVAFLGVSSEIPTAAVAGVPIVAFSMIPLLRGVAGEKVAGVLAGAVSIAWGVLVFTLLPGVMEGSDIDAFVVQGVVMVAGAVIISASATSLWSRAVNGLSRAGAGLSTRLGLVYPLARRGRTALLLGMFSLVIFTITFLAVFSEILGQQTRGLADESRAGYDIIATSAGFNPVSEDQIGSVDGVQAVAPLVRSWAEFQPIGEEEPEIWRVTGFDDRLLQFGIPVLGDRLPEYSTDRDVFEAVLAEPGLIVIDDFFLDTGSGPGFEKYSPGDEIEIFTDDGSEVLMVAGVLASDWVFAGSYASVEFVNTQLDPTPGHFYVAVEEGVDAQLLSGRLNAELMQYGMEAETFEFGVAEEVAETVAILRLFQGFLSLGLLIGVAGLSVVLIRAVRERRRAIGVLRALGTSAKVVKRSFLTESAFVAVQGVLIGAGLGLVSAYQVIVNSSTFGEANLDFVWPWAGLAIAVIVPTLAALLAAAAPAKRASMINPAVALRTE